MTAKPGSPERRFELIMEKLAEIYPDVWERIKFLSSPPEVDFIAAIKADRATVVEASAAIDQWRERAGENSEDFYKTQSVRAHAEGTARHECADHLERIIQRIS